MVRLKTESGEEPARAALLTRVEQDDEGTLRRLVLPFEARFDETEREATPNSIYDSTYRVKSVDVGLRSMGARVFARDG